MRRRGPDISIAGLGHFLAGTNVSLAGWGGVGPRSRSHRTRQRVYATPVKQNNVAEHDATSTSGRHARWAQQCAVSLRHHDNIHFTIYFNSFAFSFLFLFFTFLIQVFALDTKYYNSERRIHMLRY